MSSGEVLGGAAAAPATATAAAAAAALPLQQLSLLPPPPPRPLFAVAAVASRLPRSSSSSSSSLDQQHDAVRVVPLSRWDADDGWFDRGGNGSNSSQTSAQPPPLPKRFGAFLDGAALFDARALSLSSAEAAALDPQQRLLLECGAEALGRAPGMDGLYRREERELKSFCFFFLSIF